MNSKLHIFKAFFRNNFVLMFKLKKKKHDFSYKYINYTIELN